MNEKGKEKVRGSFEFLKEWGDALTIWTQRWIPDALVIVIVLSLVAYIFALIWGFKPEVGVGSRAYQSVQAWGKGFWVLLEFAMQMCLIMMTGYILACSPPVRRLMDGLSGWSNPEKPWQAIVVMSLFSMIVAWLNWGLSLIGSAMLALFIVRRNPKVDYRLLIAAAYLGLGCTWHSGLSGSATLLVATPDNFLIKGKLLDADHSRLQYDLPSFQSDPHLDHPYRGYHLDGLDAPKTGENLHREARVDGSTQTLCGPAKAHKMGKSFRLDELVAGIQHHHLHRWTGLVDLALLHPGR